MNESNVERIKEIVLEALDSYPFVASEHPIMVMTVHHQIPQEIFDHLTKGEMTYEQYGSLVLELVKNGVSKAESVRDIDLLLDYSFKERLFSRIAPCLSPEDLLGYRRMYGLTEDL